MSGLKLAVLYGIKPFLLGFCGPRGSKGKKTLLDFLNHKKTSLKKIRKILEQFDGACPHYKIIAKANKIKDPFDERVVRAYWVGNNLLKKAGEYKSHHSYHVLVIGSVTGRINLKGKLLDLCRICWGRVISAKCKAPCLPAGRQNAKLVVKYQPLIKNRLGKPVEKEIEWNKNLLPKVKIGDWVSFHWNQAVEVLNKEDRKNLEKYTKLTLKYL